MHNILQSQLVNMDYSQNEQLVIININIKFLIYYHRNHKIVATKDKLKVWVKRDFIGWKVSDLCSMLVLLQVGIASQQKEKSN